MNRLYNKKNILFGAGGWVKRYKEEFFNIEIFKVCDNDKKKIGGYIENIEIIDIHKLLLLYLKEDINIIISSDYISDIVEQLNSININKNIYIKLIWDLNYIKEIKEDVEVLNLVDEKKDIIKSMFKDEESRSLYENIFKYIKSYDLKYLDNLESCEKTICNKKYERKF